MTLQMCEEAAMAAIALKATHHQPRPALATAGSRADGATALRPLDPEILSTAIPAFFIGRNQAGLWVARAADGRGGGLFLFKSSAIDFANRQSAPVRCALVFPADPFELDIENQGNPLVALAARGLGELKRRLSHLFAW